MPVAFLDSNVLIGAVSRRDQDHDRALEILRGIDRGDLPTARVTNYVLAEAVSYVHSRESHGTAVDLYDRLKTGSEFEFVHAPKSSFFEAEAQFRTYERLSFVDATLVAELRRTGATYLYSFDDDFDGIDGVSRLDTADDPFA